MFAKVEGLLLPAPGWTMTCACHVLIIRTHADHDFHELETANELWPKYIRLHCTLSAPIICDLQSSSSLGLLKSMAVLGCSKQLLGDHPQQETCKCAGRAAQRMSEWTGRPAQTIHRLLGLKRSGQELSSQDNEQVRPSAVVSDSTVCGLLLSSAYNFTGRPV